MLLGRESGPDGPQGEERDPWYTPRVALFQ